MYDKKMMKLYSPEETIMQSSVSLLWDRSKNPEVTSYRIMKDDAVHAVVQCTDYTAEHLKPETQYSFYITAIDKHGNIAAKSEAVSLQTKALSERLDITAYGAVPDGATLNTKAIQSAIDSCPPGGTVYIPEGTFVTGAIFLKSDMTLYLEKLGRLMGSENPFDYPLIDYLWEGERHSCYASLLNTSENGRFHDITIAGEGLIDANGEKLFRAEIDEAKGKRGRSICLQNTDRVYLRDITVRSAPSWCVHMIKCNDISMNNVKVFTKKDEHGRVYKDVFNGDGIDLEYCRNAQIFHSLIASEDDCIAIKSGRNLEGRNTSIASGNIRITHCSFNSGFGVAIGSEMSGGVENVLVQDCVFEDVYSIGTIKAPRPRGGIIKNIVFEHCSYINRDYEHSDCKWFRGALNIDQFYGSDEVDTINPLPVDEGTSVVSDVVFRNLVIDTCAGNAVFFAGLPEQHLKNITMENIEAIGKYGMKAFNIDGLVMENVHIHARNGEAVELNNVSENCGKGEWKW